jgi:hypothetical protein
VAGVVHVSSCVVGLLATSAPTLHVLSGAVNKLRAHRRERLGALGDAKSLLGDAKSSAG